MRIHYLLFAFLLVLLSPLAAFTQVINDPIKCLINGGICWGPCKIGYRQQIGHCGLRKFRCCKIRSIKRPRTTEMNELPEFSPHEDAQNKPN
ncbi:beta-defensin 4-like [Mastomys coucha]|uniref:beta-defensin 4-like n=1 Tax=Mastomys coucha TaxID=35658 RepID=UPI001261DDA2|nr:beta-defensin 4-like [Mastomys coucha]XP_031198499.1 beta-defensin 4-like [Mastomys coucha]